MNWNHEAQAAITQKIMDDMLREVADDMAYLERCLKDYPEHTQLLCENFDAFQRATLTHNAVWHLESKQVAKDILKLSYPTPASLRDAIAFLPMFISHECHDDGTPTIAWLVNPAFPEGMPKLTPENMKEQVQLRHRTPLRVVKSPDSYPVVHCLLLGNHLEVDGKYITTYAGGLPELKLLLKHNTYKHSPVSALQVALCKLIGL